MRIRKAAKSDIKELANCFKILFRPEEIWSEEKLMESIDEKDFFLIGNNKEVAGAIGLEYGAGVCQIAPIAIKPGFQKQGLGSGLIKFSERKAKENNCHKIWCRSLKLYNADGFYKKMGFDQEGLLKNHWFGIDCYIFGKQLR